MCTIDRKTLNEKFLSTWPLYGWGYESRCRRFFCATKTARKVFFLLVAYILSPVHFLKCSILSFLCNFYMLIVWNFLKPNSDRKTHEDNHLDWRRSFIVLQCFWIVLSLTFYEFYQNFRIMLFLIYLDELLCNF